ncbi:MAG: zinc-ribbon domain-containing protein [Deltaproteobacteria bacterium]|nr:zinc-ribbon domain-containing protein [Deltaproteobacteria bacterium]
MDVQCERCHTEYEFDDALVSGRGTTVKCTNCGHKFKIRRRDGDFSEDFWNVQTGDGRTLVFTSLRELQRAIQTNLVDRNDRLSRGGLPQKAIGQIPELAPFFEQRENERREQERRRTPAPAAARGAQTLVDGSLGSPLSRSSRPPPPPGATAPALAPPRQRLSTRPDFPPQLTPEPEPAHERASYTSAVKTLTGTGGDAEVEEAQRKIAEASSAVPAPPPMRSRLASVKPAEHEHEEHADPPRAGHAKTHADPPKAGRVNTPVPAAFPDEEPDTTRFERSDPPPAERPRSAPPVPAPPRRSLGAPRARATSSPPHYEVSSPLPPPVEPAMRGGGYEPDEYEAGIRSSLPDAPHSVGRRRPVGGYVVAVFVLAGIALVGAMWARDHLGAGAGAKPAASATTDPRVTTLLATGEKALADGDLDLAKESFDKASALAEKDPRVLLDVARLAASRADVPWLKSRLLAGDNNADEQRLTKQNLVDLSAAARKAADDALAVSPDDPAALRAKVDALRISGEREAARALVSKVVTSASQPETAYVLAALDLAENEPLWSPVIERLRVAASTESGPGRARAALAFALARSGDVAAAKAEVERLASMSRPHVLLPLLRGFADRAKPSPKNETVDVHALDAGPAVIDPKHPADRHATGAVAGGSSDPRVLVSQAEKARAKGEYDKALALYNTALEHNANDTEALSGLAAIAYARRDLNGARASYKRVLSINPSYVPALVGVGDVDWDSGDKTSAMRAYKEIVDRFPEGTYPPRVKQRLDSAAAPVPAPAPTPAPAPSDSASAGGAP